MSSFINGADLFFWDEIELENCSESVGDDNFNNDLALDCLSDWLIIGEVKA